MMKNSLLIAFVWYPECAIDSNSPRTHSTVERQKQLLPTAPPSLRDTLVIAIMNEARRRANERVNENMNENKNESKRHTDADTDTRANNCKYTTFFRVLLCCMLCRTLYNVYNRLTQPCLCLCVCVDATPWSVVFQFSTHTHTHTHMQTARLNRVRCVWCAPFDL